MTNDEMKAELARLATENADLRANLDTTNEALSDSLERIELLLVDQPVEINFAVNSSKNEKAPKFYALIDQGFPFKGTVTSLPVYVKDGVPTCTIPNNYGNAPIQAKRVGAYQTDPEGEERLAKLDAEVRIAWYAWMKTHQPQPFTL